MEAILAGLIAAGISWVANGQISVRTGTKGIVCLVPAVEEGTKTLLAVLFNSSIFMSHAVFGTVEAVYDTLVTKKTGVWAGIVSYFGHMLFGLITLLLFQITGYLLVGILGGYFVHLAWNWLVYKPKPVSATNRRRGE